MAKQQKLTVAATFETVAAAIRPEVPKGDIALFENRATSIAALAILLDDGLADPARTATLHKRYDDAVTQLWSMRVVEVDDEQGDFAAASQRARVKR